MGGLLAALLVALALPVQALAAGPIAPAQTCSLTLDYHEGKTPLTGVGFSIYQVATVDETGELAATEAFTQFHLNIRGKDDAAWRALASTLEGYILRDKIPATAAGTTDSQGRLTFSPLPTGLYLVLGDRLTLEGKVYDPQPFMVLLPTLDKVEDAWAYQVTVTPKHTVRDEPSEPTPQTVSRKVLKVWKDTDHEEERPQEVVVQLLRNGDVYDTVTLSNHNGWRYTWTGLDANDDWNVVEELMDDYMVEVTQEGITFVVTNTYTEDLPDEPTPEGPGPEPTPQPTPGIPDEPDEPGKPTNPDTPPEDLDIPDEGVPLAKLPQTGQLWWPVPFMLCGGLVFLIAGLLQRRRYEA